MRAPAPPADGRNRPAEQKPRASQMAADPPATMPGDRAGHQTALRHERHDLQNQLAVTASGRSARISRPTRLRLPADLVLLGSAWSAG